MYPVFMSGYDGPKKTFGAAYTLASSGDTIYCSNGYFNEHAVITKNLHVYVKNTYLRKLTLNGSGIKLHLHGDSLHVVDTMVLNQGFIYTRGETVLFKLIPNCLVLGGSKNSFVDGRYYVGHESLSTNVFFHSGNDKDYRPFRIDFNKLGHDTIYFSGILEQGLAPVTGVFPTGIRNVSKVHYWHATTGDYIDLSNFKLTPYYDSVQNDDEVFEASRLRLLMHKGFGDWISMGGTGTADRLGNLTGTTTSDTLAFFALANANGGFNSLGSREVFARFTPPVVCTGRPANFADKSFSYKTAITSWFWTFGDPATLTDTSSAKNPSYTYPGPGKYTVKLKVVNIFGFEDSFTAQADIRSKPVVKYGFTKVCIGQTTRFTDSSLAFSPDAIMSRNWKFGDGGTSTAKNVNYVYSAPANYTVRLIVTSSAGCKDSLDKVVPVYAKPAPDYTVPASCISDSAIFLRKRSVDPLDSIVSWTWKIDSVNVRKDTLVKYLFATPGAHKAKLIGVSKYGCADSIQKSFTIYGLPAANFGLSSRPGNSSVQCLNGNRFTVSPAVTTSEGQLIGSGQWKWGDGTTTVLTDTNHTYSAQGPYTVRLIVTTDKGCTDSADNLYTVRGFITPMFNKTGVCVPDTIVFNDSAFAGSAVVNSRKWYLNGSLRASATPAKIPVGTAGPHTVKYIVSNTDGCTDSVTRVFSFTVKPVISLLPTGSSPFCEGDSFILNMTGGTRAIWLHDNDTNRRKVFRSPVRYKARVYNGPVCFDEVDDTIMVYPRVTVKAFSDTTIARGGTAVLRATGASTYIWSPSTALNTTIGATVRSKATSTQTYIVTGTDVNSCMGRDTVTVTVVEPTFVRIPNIITPNGDNENDAWDLKELQDLDLYDLSISDYQGKLVYESKNYLNDWKGTDKAGKDLPDGVYYYLLKHRNNNSELRGFIHIIR